MVCMVKIHQLLIKSASALVWYESRERSRVKGEKERKKQRKHEKILKALDSGTRMKIAMGLRVELT